MNSGGRYDPSTDSWTATTTINAPEARWAHTMEWTGSEMIVWGGTNQTIFADVLLTGAILTGGSKAIHSIFSVYESFMNSTQKRANASATAAAAKSARDSG